MEFKKYRLSNKYSVYQPGNSNCDLCPSEKLCIKKKPTIPTTSITDQVPTSDCTRDLHIEVVNKKILKTNLKNYLQKW